MKFIFAADLHLSSAEEYSFSVFEEILSLCKENEIRELILGGDVFNSFFDAEKLVERFNEAISSSQLDNIFFLTGNHDTKGASVEKLVKLQFHSKARIFSSIPFEIHLVKDIEFLFLPFQRDISAIFKKEVPSKTHKRIVIGHGSLIDFNPAGEDEESFYDNELFSYLEADIVLLGHIHKRITREKIHYPGSARVWRSGEEGKHGVLIVDSESLSTEFVPLKSGGEFISLKIEVEDDRFKAELPQRVENNQWFELFLEGWVSNRTNIEKIKKKLSEIFRAAFKYEFNEENVIDVSQFYENSLYKIFIEKWKGQFENLTDENEREIYKLARKYFLEELSRFILEKKDD